MSKPKNRIMCPDCGRAKMLFETETKANNFIKFNSDTFENGEELRAYYCPACCGYHISSKPHKRSYDSQTDRLLKAYYVDNAEAGMVKQIFDILIETKLKSKKAVNKYLRQNKIEEKYTDSVLQKARTMYYAFANIK